MECEQRREGGEGVGHMALWRRFPGRRKSKCKSSDAGACLESSRKSNEDSVAGKARTK